MCVSVSRLLLQCCSLTVYYWPVIPILQNENQVNNDCGTFIVNAWFIMLLQNYATLLLFLYNKVCGDTNDETTHSDAETDND